MLARRSAAYLPDTRTLEFRQRRIDEKRSTANKNREKRIERERNPRLRRLPDRTRRTTVVRTRSSTNDMSPEDAARHQSPPRDAPDYYFDLTRQINAGPSVIHPARAFFLLFGIAFLASAIRKLNVRRRDSFIYHRADLRHATVFTRLYPTCRYTFSNLPVEKKVNYE